MVSPNALVSLGGLLLIQLHLVFAYPASFNATLQDYTQKHQDGLERRADAKDFYLRIMPLGASITKGDFPPPDNPDHNGFRKNLRDKLRIEGWKVNMVGNYKFGNMADNDHEGVSGDRVSQVKARAQGSVRTWLPNIVLVNAGTNDATQNGAVEDVGGTGARMRQLIDVIYAIVPDTVVVLSTLIPNPAWQSNIDNINRQYRSLYREYNPLDDNGNEPENPAFKMILADMADGFITADDINDGTHPTVEGDRKMAAVWDWAIGQANNKGWITRPTESSTFKDGDAVRNCRKPYASGAEDFRGAPEVLHATNPMIREDDKFKANNKERTDRRGDWTTGDSDTTRLWFAQLYNEFGAHKLGERDELIIAYETGGDVTMQVNHGDGNFGDEQKLDIPIYCKTRGIQWGDMNGDGLDDFICIALDGELFVALNQGGNPPTFKDIGSYKKPEKGLGQANVRLGDMDGDGRVDYCVFESNGDMYCWRNGGTGEHAEYWQDMGSGNPIFHGKNMGDLKGVRLVDVNGDGRADWLWLDDRGVTTAWINNRGDGTGMIPRWVEIGITHDMKIDRSIVDDRRAVQFGRIFGDSGIADYVHWWRVDCAAHPACKFTWKGWQQLGGGSRYQKGDGINFGDVTGTGVDDYVWIRPWSTDGEVEIFINKNTKTSSDYYRTPAWSAPVRLDTHIDWRGLHVGDWDGDGKADIIGVTDRDKGSLKVWLSRWNGQDFNWDVQVVSDSSKCGEGWGVLYKDIGAHFADITNSGRVDYLCMKPDGTTTAWLRDEDGAWFNAGQVKYSEDLDRANFQFADADGDGRADLIWTDKFTGDAKVWYNLQQGTDSDRAKWGGSLFEWAPPSSASYRGSTRGPNEYFANLGGEGRADIVGASALTAKATVWFNSCPSGGDDGDLTDPKLPEYTPSDGPPDGGDSPGSWFCGLGGDDWDIDLWTSHNMGPWLQSRTSLYSGVDATWPKSPNKNPEQNSGVPRVIARFDGLTEDGAWNWDDTCRKSSSLCTLSDNDVGENKHCLQDPQRAFSLWSMRNYAHFLQNWHGKVADATFQASLDVAGIASTFLQNTPDESQTSPTAWLTLAVGVIGVSTAFLSAPASGVSAIVSGTLSAANGALSMISPVAEDPRFTTFAQLQDNLGDVLKGANDAIDAYFNRLLVDSPPDHDLDKGQELAKILKDGAFANQDFAAQKDSIDENRARTLIEAGIIAEAWNSGAVAIVKWSKDSKLAQKWAYSPCFGGDRYGLDHAVACQFGKNYMIGRQFNASMGSLELQAVGEWPDVGQSEDTLKKYGLNHRILIQSAERVQAAANSYVPRGIDTVKDVFDDLIKNPITDGQAIFEKVLSVNVPVCDLDTFGDNLVIPRDTDVYGNYCQDGIRSAIDVGDCLLNIFNKNCAQLPKLGDSAWPYQADIETPRPPKPPLT